MIQQLLNSNHNTLLLYFGAVIASTVSAALSQRRITTWTKRDHVNRLWYLMSFSCVAVIATFSGVGRDRSAYIEIYETITFSRIIHGSEPGFELIQYISHQLIKNPNIFLAMIGFCTVYNVYRGLWEFRKEISLGLAVFLYTSQYFFQGLSLIRIYFAASILIRFAYLIKKERYTQYGVVLAISATIHYSVVFAMMAYVIALCFIRVRRHSYWIMLLVISIIFIISIASVDLLGILLLFPNNRIVYKYSLFLEQISNNPIGFKWIYNMFPYVIILSLRRFFGTEEKKYVSISMAYLAITVCISILSYSVPVIGRGLILLGLPSIIVLPMGVRLYRKAKLGYYNVPGPNLLKIGFRISSTNIGAICLAWGTISLLLYFAEYLTIDAIDNYQLMRNWN